MNELASLTYTEASGVVDEILDSCSYERSIKDAPGAEEVV